MKKKIIFLVVIFFTIVLLTGIVFLTYQYVTCSKFLDVRTEELKYEYSFKEISNIEDLREIGTADGNICVIFPNDTGIYYNTYSAYRKICPNSSYLLFRDIDFSEKDIWSNGDEIYRMRFLTNYSKFQIKIYDIETKKYVKIIDVNNILKKYAIYQADKEYYVTWSDNKEKIAIKMIPSDKNAYDMETWKILLIDPETEEVEVKDYQEVVDNTSTKTIEELNAWRDKKGLLIQEQFDNPNDKNIYSYSFAQFYNFPGMLEVVISTNQLPNENDKLYEMFPALKEYIGKNGYSVTMVLKEEVAREIFLGQ